MLEFGDGLVEVALAAVDHGDVVAGDRFAGAVADLPGDGEGLPVVGQGLLPVPPARRTRRRGCSGWRLRSRGRGRPGTGSGPGRRRPAPGSGTRWPVWPSPGRRRRWRRGPGSGSTRPAVRRPRTGHRSWTAGLTGHRGLHDRSCASSSRAGLPGSRCRGEQSWSVPGRRRGLPVGGQVIVGVIHGVKWPSDDHFTPSIYPSTTDLGPDRPARCVTATCMITADSASRATSRDPEHGDRRNA